ncbi:HdeD family acid-resistance protein [Aureimonas mangrovi]|uniref:HdeD family acid-resistance protein n=1 Tax=Aureimonas mangrovi TaxID=2758041 RepID=UPI00163DBBB8|nr:HdeD family acid-resistance protein [Aureimonas mangrovi]
MTTSAEQDWNAAANEARRELRERWKSFAFQGALMLVIGFLAIVMPFAATFATVLFFGWLLLIGGIFAVIGAFSMRRRRGFGSQLAIAVASILLGLVMLFDPFAGAVALTWLLALFFLISAYSSWALSREMKAHGLSSWPLILSAAVNVILALYIVIGLPQTAVIAVGLFIGISFAMSGATLLIAALEARR